MTGTRSFVDPTKFPRCSPDTETDITDFTDLKTRVAEDLPRISLRLDKVVEDFGQMRESCDEAISQAITAADAVVGISQDVQKVRTAFEEQDRVVSSNNEMLIGIREAVQVEASCPDGAGCTHAGEPPLLGAYVGTAGAVLGRVESALTNPDDEGPIAELRAAVINTTDGFENLRSRLDTTMADLLTLTDQVDQRTARGLPLENAELTASKDGTSDARLTFDRPFDIAACREIEAVLIAGADAPSGTAIWVPRFTNTAADRCTASVKRLTFDGGNTVVPRTDQTVDIVVFKKCPSRATRSWSVSAPSCVFATPNQVATVERRRPGRVTGARVTDETGKRQGCYRQFSLTA
ncbi:MAG: hypothetical protein M5U09_01465 [Gammaproteobacteria bacterium]|nr:hypothetical protein [Gammaproteobacteria bacterium]